MTVVPTSRETKIPSHLFRVVLLTRLRRSHLPMWPSTRRLWLSSGGLCTGMDVGDAAVSLWRAWRRGFAEAGGRVRTNMLVRDMDLDVPVTDNRRFGGCCRWGVSSRRSPFSHSRANLVVVAVEVGGAVVKRDALFPESVGSCNCETRSPVAPTPRRASMANAMLCHAGIALLLKRSRLTSTQQWSRREGAQHS